MTECILFYTSFNDMYIDLSEFNLLEAVEFFFKNQCCIQILDNFKNIIYELKFESYKNLILFLHKPIHNNYILYIKSIGAINVKLYGYTNNKNTIYESENEPISHKNNNFCEDNFESKRICKYICKLHDNTKSICEIYECNGN